MSLIVNDVLEWVSRVLVESTLNTVLPAPVGPGVGVVAVVDPAIYLGALLVVGAGNSLEIITVTAISGANFTANFANGHQAGETLKAATFPSGQVSQYVSALISPAAAVQPLFTQAEMLGYLRDVQNDFLETTRLIFAITTQNLTQNVPVNNTPADSIRVERIQIGGTSLWNVSQEELDMYSPSWQAEQGAPSSWYQNHLNTSQYAVAPPPPVGLVAELWYSQKGITLPLLTDSLIVPDIFGMYLKYGVLQKAWEKDGETKDARRSAYCGKRYMRGVQYGLKFSQAIQMGIKSNG